MTRKVTFAFSLFAVLALSGTFDQHAIADDGSDVLTNNGGAGTLVFGGGAFVSSAAGYFGLGGAADLLFLANELSDDVGMMFMDDDTLENTDLGGIDFGG